MTEREIKYIHTKVQKLLNTDDIFDKLNEGDKEALKILNERCLEVKNIILSVKESERTDEMKIDYLIALNIFCSNNIERENIYNELKKLEKSNFQNIDFLYLIISVSINLEIYNEAILYIKKALKLYPNDKGLKEMLDIYKNYI